MQERQLEALTSLSMDNRISKPETVKKKISTIHSENNKALKDKLSDYERTPTEDELMKMREWAIGYKRLVPNASKRRVRKAVQEHFNIRIYK